MRLMPNQTEIYIHDGRQQRKWRLIKCEDCSDERMVRGDSSPRKCRRCANKDVPKYFAKSVARRSAARGSATCAYCKRVFFIPPSGVKTKAPYCSQDCRYADMRFERNCIGCGVLFQLRKSLTMTTVKTMYGHTYSIQNRGFYCAFGCWQDHRNGITGRKHKFGPGRTPVVHGVIRAQRG